MATQDNLSRIIQGWVDEDSDNNSDGQLIFILIYRYDIVGLKLDLW